MKLMDMDIINFLNRIKIIYSLIRVFKSVYFSNLVFLGKHKKSKNQTSGIFLLLY